MDKPQRPKKKNPTRKKQSRRRFLRSLALGGGTIGVSMLGLIPVYQAQANPRLRPPGALAEKDFLASCIKCGQCVQVCPVYAIKLADINDGFGIGVPYIDARAQACDFSCDAVQCVLACPTGSLSHDIDKKEQVRMGIARLDRPKDCLAVQGKGFKGLARGQDYDGHLRYEEIDRWNPIAVSEHPYDLPICDLCVRQCPIEGAISLQPLTKDENDKRQIPVVHETCVGCGVCEMICPTEPASIVIDERKTWEQT
ncbi:4Fe-4S dicluster domain-containing protein [Candidatus Venteria ishoeyi]|uniref:Quinol dehydrogenase periplasmic component n=1 Tax=Candidatus Venteria ishoeyi TaxID=1899563 RepID=A0A1H6FG22_9GAMM|nr:4Fe-4S dicluster domain-containing protein [Candidatus Venteria ishoeyi]MDM8547897.1 4Fe-4S dicluster domain-containing protein [Candidatus Venteria ishoeyi]SEH08987.1 quinol dehydrogenase periplasmic component [Candidatus Venteria ishoeyi]